VSLAAPAAFRPPVLARALRTARLGRAVEFHPSLASTNDRALEWARAGAPHGAVVVADEQTRGRGRHGRAWHSAHGQGVWASVVLRPARPAGELGQLPLVVGLALGEALGRDLELRGVSLRWPNDVDVRGRKVAGVLCERCGGSEPAAVVAGVGINVGRGAVPPELAAAATSLAAEGLAAAREAVLAALLGRLEQRLEAWEQGGFGALRADYLACLEAPGGEARLGGAAGAGTEVRGTFVTVDGDGALVLRTAAGVQAFHAGQVERVG